MKKNIKLLFGLLSTFALMLLVSSCDNKAISVSWMNEDGSVIKEITVSSLEGLEYDGQNPTKASNAEYTFTFEGWQKKENEDGSVSYIPIFKASKNKYSITFKDDDGTILSTKSLEYGTKAADIEKPENPTKTSDQEVNYVFAGWDKEIKDVTGDAVYTATYSSVKNKYSVTFKNEDGSVLKEATLYEYGTKAADIEKPTPAKQGNAEYSYEFAGWDKEIEAVTGNVEYKATFKAIKNKYNVTFVDDNGVVLKEAKAYEYGTLAADIEKPETPTKARTAEYTYEFSGWDKQISDVTEDVTYTATYNSYLNKYSITFVDEDGTTVLKETKVYDYGTLAANIEKPENPTKANTQAYTYEFAGWDNEVANVSADVVYKATYSETLNKYSVTFLDEDGVTVLKTATLYGYGTLAADIEKPETPTKARTAKYTYEFNGWNNAVLDVTEDVTYVATYKESVNKYEVTFVDEDGTTVLKATKAYEYGTLAADIEKPETPTKARTAQYTYEFAGWDNEVADVTTDVVYKATYNSTLNKYNVTFVDEDGTTVLKETKAYDYGTLVVNIDVPTNVVKASNPEYDYEFAGWNNAVLDVTEDVTYKATYTATLRVYSATLESNIDEAGELTDINDSYTVHDKINLKVTLKSGYTFVGWFVNGTSVSDKLEYEYEMPTSDIEVVATYIYYTVTATSSENGVVGHYVKYDLNYEGAPEAEVFFVEEGNGVPYKSYYRQSYNFRAWYVDKECTKVYDPNSIIDKDITLYAGWFSYTNAVLINELSNDPTSTREYALGREYPYGVDCYYIAKEKGTIRFNYRSTGTGGFTVSANNLTKGVEFCWYNQTWPYKGDQTYDEVEVDLGDILYFDFGIGKRSGSYQAFCYCTFSLTNLPVAPKELGKATVMNDTKVSVGDMVSVAAAPKDGYTFMGWYAGDKCLSTNATYEFVMTNENVNIEAKYATSRILVETEDDTKIKVTADTKTYLGQKAKISAELIANSGTFMGWYLNGELVSYEKEIEVDVTDKVQTYKAVYDTTRVLTKSQDTNYITCGVSNVVQSIGEEVELNVQLSKNAQNLNYAFIGWYVDGKLVGVGRYFKVTVTEEKVTYEARYGTSRMVLNNNIDDAETGSVSGDQYAGYPYLLPTIKAFGKVGYTFVGWYKGDELISTEQIVEVMPTNEIITYTAHFIDCTVLVDKNVDGGTVELLDKTFVGANANIQAKANDGYTFLGWYLEDGTLYSTDSKVKVVPTLEKVKYIAKFDTSRVTLVKTNYAAGTAKVTNNKYIGNNATLSVEVNDGYSFVAWYKDDQKYSDEASLTVAVTEELQTFEVRFDKYLVTFMNEGEEYSKASYAYGTLGFEIVEPTGMTKASDPEFDYSFKAWNKEFETVTDDQVYTATYNGILRIYKTSLETNMTEACELTEINSTYTVHDKINLKAKLTKGYTFVGWVINGKNVSQDLEYEYEMPTTDIKVVATFEYFTVTAKTTEDGMVGHYVTYDYNYDKGPADEVVFVKAGDSLPNKFVSKSDSVFRGWFLDEECTKVLPNEYEIAEDITLYAGWYEYYSSQYPTTISPLNSDPTTTEVYKGGAGTQYSSYRYFYYVAPADGTVTFVITSYQCSATIRNITQNKTYYGGYKYSPYDQDMTYADKTKQIPVNKGDVLYFHFGRIDNKTSFSLKFYLTTLPVEARNITCSSADNTKVTVGENVTFSAAPNDGYTFMGWYDDETLVSTDSQYTFEMTRENVNLVAKYDTARVLVESSNTDLGTVSMPAKTYLGAKVKLQASTIASGKGGAYLGWYDEDDNLLSTSRTLEVEVTKDVKKYIAKYDTIRVCATTPDTTIGTVDNPSDQQYIGETASLYVNTRNTNYAFAGWYLNGELVTTECNFKPIVTKDIVTYEARFGELKIKLTSNLEGTTQTTAAQYMGYNVQISTSYVENTTFLGWYNGDELVATGTYTKVIVPTEPITLTAKYVEGYTVKAVADVEGAVITMPKSGSVGFGDEIRVRGVDGYTFMGWYCDGERIAKADYFQAYPTEEVKTYIAHFDTPRVVVTVNDENAGTATVDERVKYLCNQFTYIEATAKDGYKFVGWYLNGELAETTARTVIYMSDDVVTYEARFEKIEE